MQQWQGGSMESGVKSLNDYSTDTLLELVESYPWFSAGREELLKRLIKQNRDCWQQQYKENLLYLSNRGMVIEMINRIINEGREKVAVEEESIEIDMDSINMLPKPKKSVDRIVVVGGDFFTREELEEVKNDGGYTSMIEKRGVEVDYQADDFYTETLAKIYAEQEYYDKALEVYSKLILLYPEKSSYFANLVREIKLKSNKE